MLDFFKDKALWDKVRNSEDFARHRVDIEEMYVKAFEKSPRPHSLEDILENNDRGLWHDQLMQLQSSAMMALIYPDNEEYYNNLLRIIWAYCNEYSWAPLGHYTEFYYGRTPKDFDCGLIDIFAASVGFSMAEIKSLFKDRFPRLIIDRMTYEIRRRIIEPYRTRRFFWEKHDNNWNAVCTGAVGGVLIYEDPDVFFENQERLHRSMECYLASFRDDGMCVEGVGYWTFGFGFFMSYATLEREITNGAVDWFARPKVKEIAKYLQKVFLQKDMLVTYGDCNIEQKYYFAQPHMLKTIYGDEIESLPPERSEIKDNSHFNFLLRSVVYYNKDFVSSDIKGDVTYWTKNSAYFVKRTPNYGFSAKGGNNGESHNHIDVGTFILAKNNRHIIADIGAGPYEEGYHDKKRYTFFHPSAYAHSMPLFDGVGEDSFGREYVLIDYNEEKSEIGMDITSAYGASFLKKAYRSFIFTENSVTLCDSFELAEDKEITERLIAVNEPKILDNVAVIDGVALVQPDGITPSITVKDVKSHRGFSHKVYIIDYVLKKGQREFTLTFDLK